MKKVVTRLNIAVLTSLICSMCHAAEPKLKQCVADLNFSERLLSGKNVADCGFESVGALCAADGQCNMYVNGMGMWAGHITFTPKPDAKLESVVHELSGILIQSEADGSHLQFKCVSTACILSWKIKNQTEEKHLKFGQTVIAPLTTQVTFNYLSTL